ncbi:MAG: hypothetical protein GYB65_19670 [Chloroflexi bacterium]|nr:hypothetical protein [Chloroflexota bacterium]
MERYTQFTITLGALGVVIALIGLFPGIIGLETTEGVGVLQVLVLLAGFSVLFLAAYIFVKRSFYAGLRNTLAQDIGIRLTMTGLLAAAAAGLADVLGFGSHPGPDDARPMLGRLQAIALVSSILVASLGVVIYAIFGPEDSASETDDSDNPAIDSA